MKVKVNDTEIIFPSKLSDITLGQRIDFHNTYGKEMDKAFGEIAEIKDDFSKDLEITMWQVDMACKTFAFFSGIDLLVVQESESLAGIMEVYHTMKDLLAADSQDEPKNRFEWKGETWALHPPELKSTSTMTFIEFVSSKQIVQDISEFGESNWDVMLRLAAIYLRKEGEPFNKLFAEPDSDRVELMKELPMDIAIHVGFFLKSSMRLFLNTLQSSEILQPKADAISEGTLNNGVGLIS